MRSLALFLLTLLFANSSNAFNASGNYWEEGQATFRVGISGNSPTGGSWDAAFNRAMDAWSDATEFQYIAIDAYHDPCIGGGVGESEDNVNGIDFVTDVCGTEFGGNVLAITLTAGNCANSSCNSFHITNVDIVFNDNETWDIYDGPLRFGFKEFERVALHELGHALGLNHEPSKSAIMQSLVGPLNTLTSDDIAGANAIYGAEVTFESIYGIDIILPAVTTLIGPNDSVSFSGNLTVSDTTLDGKFIDLYQYTFENDSTVDVQVTSAEIDAFLYLVRVTSTQDTVPAFTFADDDSGQGSNSRINQVIQAGTYWIGVTSAGNADQGSYDVSIIAFTSTPPSSFESFLSIYGANVEVNPNPNIKGDLSDSDFKFEGKALDLYQFDVLSSTNLRFDLSSSDFDPTLIVVEIDSSQQLGTIVLENNDGGTGTNSRIEQTLSPGTYWIGVTSFTTDETGDYNIDVSVIFP